MALRDPFVIPLRAKEKRPAEQDWQLHTARLSEAPKRWPGVDRWGMPTGPINGVWCLDIDTKTNGPATLETLEKEHGPLPRTRTVRTPSGGRHLYFRWDPERPVGCWVSRLPGLDTRGPGGQAVIPPTEGYTIIDDTEPVDAPDWLYAALSVAAPDVLPDQARGDRPGGLPMDRDGALRDVRGWPAAVSGTRDRSVWRLAVRLVRGRGLLPEAAAELIEEHWNPRCEPPLAGDELKAIARACERAVSEAQVPWGYLFYEGKLNTVLLRALKRYGPKGQESACIPFRVWPDGRMLRLDHQQGLCSAVLAICQELGISDLNDEAAWRYVGWWKIHQTPSALHPKPLAIGDEPGPALARIEPVSAPTPNWDEFLSRLDHQDVFLAWLWMLTLPVATRQVLWIYGGGHDGKTEATKVIASVLGGAATTLNDGFLDASGRWVGSQVYGKRLVLVDDTKLRQVLRRGIVHLITGRSLMKCENKGVDAFDFEPNAQVLLTSNWHPVIGRGRADKTRLIELEISAGTQTPDYKWPERLREEFPALLARGKEAYERLCVRPGEPALKLPPAIQARLDKAAQHDNDTFTEMLEKAGLVLDPDAQIKSREFLDRLNVKPNSAEWFEMRDWLEEQGVHPDKTGKNGERIWRGVRAA